MNASVAEMGPVFNRGFARPMWRFCVSLLLVAGACGGDKFPSQFGDGGLDSSGVVLFDAMTNKDARDVDAGAPADDLRLSTLVLSHGTLSPAFSPALTLYTADIGTTFGGTFTLTPTTESSAAAIAINGMTAMSGSASMPLTPITSTIDVAVTNADGTTHYTIRVVPHTGQEAYVKASNTAAQGKFGSALAVSADGNTLVVGAIGDASKAKGIGGDQQDKSAAVAGAVYVFSRTGTLWRQSAYIKASNTDAGDAFGTSVALSGDGDTLVVGAPSEASSSVGINGVQTANSLSRAGAAYVFQRTGAVWVQQAYIKASNTQMAGAFGTSVAISGETVVVGSPGEASDAIGVNALVETDTSMPAAGAVYAFSRSGTTWTQQAYIKASNTLATSVFGTSVALTGNILLVGSPGESSDATGVNMSQTDTSMPSAGAVYAFQFASSAWAQFAYIKPSNTRAGEVFGSSVAFDGSTLAVSAPAESSAALGVGGNQNDTTATGAGAVYVLTLDTQNGAWTQQAYVKASNTRASARFGSAVTLLGDTLVVGSVNESSSALGFGGDQATTSDAGAGAAYIFARLGTTWSQSKYVKASNTRAGAGFGYSAALSADTLALGSWDETSDALGVGGLQGNSSDANAGAVYVFR